MLSPMEEQGIAEMKVKIQSIHFEFMPEQTPRDNIHNARSQLMRMFMQLSAIPHREGQDAYYESKRSAIRERLSATLDDIVIDNFPCKMEDYHMTCDEMRTAVLKEACVVLGLPCLSNLFQALKKWTSVPNPFTFKKQPDGVLFPTSEMQRQYLCQATAGSGDMPSPLDYPFFRYI